MKVVHIPFSFPPDPIGGTEVYVEALSRQQQQEGITAVVAAPGQREDFYSYRGINVRRFSVSERVQNIRELYGDGDEQAAKSFARVLEDEAPDLVHLHALTRGVSIRLVREAKRRETPVVFSYHTPTVSCQRGTLLRWGTDLCDGTLAVRTCSQCSLHGLGLGRTLSTVAGWIPSRVGQAVGAFGKSGGAWTALRTTELVALRHAAFRSLISEVDQFVALCDWVKDLLLRNGVPETKITLSRQGLGLSEGDSAPTGVRRRDTRARLRVMYAGRLDPTKGVHILIEALTTAPNLPVELDIYGVVQGETGAAYLRELKNVAPADSRVTFRNSLPSEDIVLQMREYDVVAVPSQWLETGPMVVLEAFAAGVPVLGSNLGGIAELVTHHVDGLLLEPQSPDMWRMALQTLCSDQHTLATLRNGVRSPRRISDVARDMSRLYSGLIGDPELAAQAVSVSQ